MNNSPLFREISTKIGVPRPALPENLNCQTLAGGMFHTPNPSIRNAFYLSLARGGNSILLGWQAQW